MESKIAIQTDEKGSIVGFSTVYDPSTLPDGWQEVANDPYFNDTDYSNWSVKDGQLVKSDTGLTPIEENQKAITELTQLANQQQQAITELTQTVASQAVADNKEDK